MTKRQMMHQTRSYLSSTQKRPDVVQSFFEESHVAYGTLLVQRNDAL